MAVGKLSWILLLQGAQQRLGAQVRIVTQVLLDLLTYEHKRIGAGPPSVLHQVMLAAIPAPSVTAPRALLETRRAYLARTPLG